MIEQYLVAFVAVLVVLSGVAVIAQHYTDRITESIRGLGASYEELYRTQHREVMDALKRETHKALEDTKALVLEHSELRRLIQLIEEDSGDGGPAV